MKKKANVSTLTKIYPDTAKGAIESLREGSELDMRRATARPDQVVAGVWAVTLPKEGMTAIVYLAGYKDPMGYVREHNDFEIGY